MERHIPLQNSLLGETEMLRLVQAAQCCTEREYVDYNPPQKAHRSTDWERMGGYTADAKSKNYLEDEDLA